MSKEIWKEIKDYEGLYQISNLGRLKSLDRIVKYKDGRKRFFASKIKTTPLDAYGYPMSVLNKNGVKKTKKIHRLVAKAFIPNPQNKPEVNHINEVKNDNRVENLEWCTRQENATHRNLPIRANREFKPIVQYKDGKPVMIWKSAREAGRCGFNQGNINNCLKGRAKTMLGYTFKYF